MSRWFARSISSASSSSRAIASGHQLAPAWTILLRSVGTASARGAVTVRVATRAIGAHAFGGRAKDVGEIAPHLALVDQPGETAGAGQYTQKRHFGQAHCARAIVDHEDLVAGERQFIAAPGTGPVYRGDEFDVGTRARILDAVARLVGEFAEIDHFGV